MIHIPEGEVEVLRVQGHINAEPILAALRANGIPARMLGEALGTVYGLTLDGIGEVAILVPVAYAERARELLADAELGGLTVEDGNDTTDGSSPVDDEPPHEE